MALLSALDPWLSRMEGVTFEIIDYCGRVRRYLQAAQNIERMLLQPDQSTPQQQSRSIALLPSREQSIAVIAAQAGLFPEEVPYLALALEGAVRSVERWKFRTTLSSLVQASRGLLRWGEPLWRQIRRQLFTWGIEALMILICCEFLVFGLRSCILLSVTIIVILVNLATVSAFLSWWFVPD